MKKFLTISIIILAVVIVGVAVSCFYKIPKEEKKPWGTEQIPVEPQVPAELLVLTIEEVLDKGYGTKPEGLGGPGVEMPTNYFIFPSLIDEKVIATNETHSAIYLIEDHELTTLVSAPRNHLSKYTISPDQNLIGFKLIERPGGLSYPAVYDISSHQIIPLHDSVGCAGAPTFSDDGKIIFTIGPELIVKDGVGGPIIKRIDLRNYLNVDECLSTFTPVSPNGQFVVGKDLEDQLWIINLENEEISCFTDGAYGYMSPIWSPDSKKIAYLTNGGNLRIYDLVADDTYSLGDLHLGSLSRFPWLPGSEYLIFHLDQIKPLRRFINSDLFLAKFDASSIIQLTDTEDIYEMDPKFSQDGEKVVFRAYISGGEIYSGRFERFELIEIEKLYP